MIDLIRRDRKSSQKKKRTRLGAAAVLAASLVVGPSLPSYAIYYDGGMPSPYFNFEANTVNSTWKTYFQEASARWTQSAAQAAIGRVTSSNNTATSANYSQSWYGYYQPYGNRGTRSFAISINTRTLLNDAGGSIFSWIASTTTHEFGHALSLGDNPVTTQTSLMKHSRDRSVTIAPTAYDTNEVNAIY